MKPDKCIKCGTVDEFYLKWIGKHITTYESGQLFKGECMIYTCPVCGWSFSRDPVQKD